MSEIYIGTDIISVHKIKKILISYTKVKFLKRIFTEKEIEYCNIKSIPEIHFAGRFAAKEAITKAILSSDILESINMKSIEILSGSDSRPLVNLNVNLNINYCCKVSISHTNDNAIAFAIFEVKK